MVDSLRVAREIDAVAIYSSCAKLKEGDGRSEAEECNLDVSQRPLADGPL